MKKLWGSLFVALLLVMCGNLFAKRVQKTKAIAPPTISVNRLIMKGTIIDDENISFSLKFTADAEKKAQALYWLSKIALEIADTEYAEFKGKPDQDENKKSNPYKFYKDLSSQFRNELKSHYSYTEWAQKS